MLDRVIVTFKRIGKITFSTPGKQLEKKRNILIEVLLSVPHIMHSPSSRARNIYAGMFSSCNTFNLQISCRCQPITKYNHDTLSQLSPNRSSYVGKSSLRWSEVLICFGHVRHVHRLRICCWSWASPGFVKLRIYSKVQLTVYTTVWNMVSCTCVFVMTALL